MKAKNSPKGSTAPEALMSSQPALLLGAFGVAEAFQDLRWTCLQGLPWSSWADSAVIYKPDGGCGLVLATGFNLLSAFAYLAAFQVCSE